MFTPKSTLAIAELESAWKTVEHLTYQAESALRGHVCSDDVPTCVLCSAREAIRKLRMVFEDEIAAIIEELERAPEREKKEAV